MICRDTQFYFAYGANLDVAGIRGRCPHAVLVGRAVLQQHRFIIYDRGVASVVPDPSRDVHGLLWELRPADVEALDAFEGVGEGFYSKCVVDVEVDGGISKQALIYIGSNETPGVPRAGYLERILGAARRHGFPGEYIEELRGWRRPER